MWHNIKQIAKTYRFNEAAFTAFARANVDKFSLIEEGDSLQVNTWNADSLIDGFKALIISCPQTSGIAEDSC
jgi:hypothetical protein